MNAFALACLCWVLEFHLSPASTDVLVYLYELLLSLLIASMEK